MCRRCGCKNKRKIDREREREREERDKSSSCNHILWYFLQHSIALPLITHVISLIFSFVYQINFFWPHPRHVEILRPGVKPAPQQWPELLQWKHWIFNALGHQGTPQINLRGKKMFPNFRQNAVISGLGFKITHGVDRIHRSKDSRRLALSWSLMLNDTYTRIHYILPSIFTYISNFL